VPFDPCWGWFTLCDLGSKGIPLSRPYTSIIQHLCLPPPPPPPPPPPSPPPYVSFLSLHSLLLSTNTCALAPHTDPEILVVCKSSIWNSMSSCTGKERAKLSASLTSSDSQFVVYKMYGSCMHLLKSCGWVRFPSCCIIYLFFKFWVQRLAGTVAMVAYLSSWKLKKISGGLKTPGGVHYKLLER